MMARRMVALAMRNRVSGVDEIRKRTTMILYPALTIITTHVLIMLVAHFVIHAMASQY
jgi:hypothetical protein